MPGDATAPILCPGGALDERADQIFPSRPQDNLAGQIELQWARKEGRVFAVEAENGYRPPFRIGCEARF